MLDSGWSRFSEEPRERKRKLHFEKLAETLGAKLLLPGDPGLDKERRIWNARLDHMPAAIVRCDKSLDVAETVRFARGQEIPVSVGENYTRLVELKRKWDPDNFFRQNANIIP